MNKGLERELKKINDQEFLELRHSINIASKIRVIKRDYEITNEDLAKRLDKQVPEVEKMLNACYPFDVKIISTIEAYEDELYNEPIDDLEEE